jgi:serine/threonine protein kinase
LSPADSPKTAPSSASASGQELRGALSVGTRLRGYELISVLGQGAFGITYRARDTILARDVAIKEYLPTALALREDGALVVPRSPAAAEEFIWGRDRFVDEARTLARLDHAPAVVRVHDFLEANGTAYMVMALVEGETLDRRIRRDGPLPPEAVERLLHRVLDGLEQVHGVGFVHRDIKPANIILDANGEPTLVDFGSSRAALAGHTAAMTAVFTPGYAAAEQFSATRQGPWTDIYGLSATLYDAITGKAPPSAFDRLLDDDCVPLCTLRPAGFAPALLAGIDAGLAVRAADRPPSIAAWRRLLADADGNRPTVEWHAPPAGATPAPPPATATRTRLGLYAGVAAAVLGLAAGGYLSLAPQPVPPPPTPSVTVQEAAKPAALSPQAGEAADPAVDLEAAEAGEAALRLSTIDRERIQVALTSLGFDTHLADGWLGPHSRQMIADWQKASGQPATGFLTSTQLQALLHDGAAVLSKFDEEQRRRDDERKDADDARPKPFAPRRRPPGDRLRRSRRGSRRKWALLLMSPLQISTCASPQTEFRLLC